MQRGHFDVIVLGGGRRGTLEPVPSYGFHDPSWKGEVAQFAENVKLARATGITIILAPLPASLFDRQALATLGK